MSDLVYSLTENIAVVRALTPEGRKWLGFGETDDIHRIDPRYLADFLTDARRSGLSAEAG